MKPYEATGLCLIATGLEQSVSQVMLLGDCEPGFEGTG